MRKKKLIDEDQAQLEYAADKLEDARLLYQRQQPRRWVVLILFLILGGAIGYYAPTITNFLSVAMYDRKSLDQVMYEYLGGITLKQVISDEVMLVAYDYNSQQPRFYSKTFDDYDTNIFGRQVYEATGASSAAPTYFDPKFIRNDYGIEEI